MPLIIYRLHIKGEDKKMPTSHLIGIKGSGAYFPKQKVEVKELAEKYKLNYNQIFTDHGVKSIHVASHSEDELFMAIKATEQALKDSKVSSDDIDLVIYCKGISHQKSARSMSVEIIQKIKATGAYGFDIEGGLIGGLIGIQIANDIIKNNYYIRNAIIVASQEFDELYLFGGGEARLKNMIFGDGAAAIVLSKDSGINSILVSDFVVDHNTSFIDDMLTENYKKEIGIKKIFNKLRVSTVVKKITRKQIFSKLTERWAENSYSVVESCIKSIHLDISDINYFIKTQLSLEETELVAKKLKITTNRIYNSSSECGHLGHADILFNLHSTLKNIDLHNLDIIALVAANYDCSSGAIIIRR
jgi:3-oxoacyl-[acyl-carrier-protein] synthase III